MAWRATSTAARNTGLISSGCWRGGRSRRQREPPAISRFLICVLRKTTPSAAGYKLGIMTPTPRSLPDSIDATLDLLAAADYLADRSLATVLFLALKMGRPLFLEGEAGVGKTEIAKVLSTTLGRRLIRLQCYEGLDVAAAVYEWNYAAQMIAIRVAEAEGARDRERLEHDVFSERFLIKRPLLQDRKSTRLNSSHSQISYAVFC